MKSNLARHCVNQNEDAVFLSRAASYDQVCLLKACVEMMICQEIKWPIPRNAKTLLVVAFPRRVRVFAVLIVRAQKERRKSYANADIRPAVERLPTFSLWTRTSPTTRYYPKIKPLFISTSLSGCVELEIGQCFVKVCRGFETLFRSVSTSARRSRERT